MDGITTLLYFQTFISCVPVPKQSTSFGKGHSYTPKKQRDYVKKIKAHMAEAYTTDKPLQPPIRAHLTFLFTPSKANARYLTKTRNWYPHLGRLDLDNLTKPIFLA